MTLSELATLKPGDRIRQRSGNVYNIKTVQVVPHVTVQLVEDGPSATKYDTGMGDYETFMSRWTKLPDDLKAEDFVWISHANRWDNKRTGDMIYFAPGNAQFLSKRSDPFNSFTEALADLNARRAK